MFTSYRTPTGWRIEHYRLASKRYRLDIRNPRDVIIVSMYYGPYEGKRVEQVVNAFVGLSGASFDKQEELLAA